MKYIYLAAISIILLSIPVSSYSQEVKDKALNLDRIADDLKYQNGVQFIELKRYDKALEVLHEYLEIFNDGIHRDEAYMNIADIYFKRFQYQKAVSTYRSLYEEFSTTDEGIRAYFQIGICYKKMGYDERAVDIFKDITDNHPESGVINQARVQMDVLNLLK